MRPLPSSATRALVALLLAGVAFLYYYRLTATPMYIAHDEAMFGVVSHEIAWHGRDVDGRFLPMMMPMSGVYWNMPAHVYLTALFVRVLGTSEETIRASNKVATDTARINDGQWHHVAVAISLNNNVSFYVDGVLSSVSPLKVTGAGSGYAFLYVGQAGYAPLGNYFNGSLDDVQIYGRALSPAEIAVVAGQ